MTHRPQATSLQASGRKQNHATLFLRIIWRTKRTQTAFKHTQSSTLTATTIGDRSSETSKDFIRKRRTSCLLILRRKKNALTCVACSCSFLNKAPWLMNHLCTLRSSQHHLATSEHMQVHAFQKSTWWEFLWSLQCHGQPSRACEHDMS